MGGRLGLQDAMDAAPQGMPCSPVILARMTEGLLSLFLPSTFRRMLSASKKGCSMSVWLGSRLANRV